MTKGNQESLYNLIMMKNLNRRLIILLGMCFAFIIVINAQNSKDGWSKAEAAEFFRNLNKDKIEKSIKAGVYSKSNLKGAGNKISSIDNFYCSDFGVVNIVPDVWHPDVVDVEWIIVTNVAGLGTEYHPDWADIEGTGSSTVLKFHTDRVPEIYFDKEINFQYTQINAGGLTVDFEFDDTKIYRMPTIYTLSSIDNEICLGESITIDLQNSETGIRYQLKDQNDNNIGFSFDGLTGSKITFVVTPNVDTEYHVVATNTVENSCTINMGNTVNVTVNNLPSFNSISPDETICAGQPYTLEALTDMDPDVDYLWDDGNGNTAPTATWVVTPNSSTSYTVTATNRITGCNSTRTVNVTVNQRPTGVIDLSGNNTICNGEDSEIRFILTGVGPWDIKYSDGSATLLTTTANSSPHTVTVTPNTSTTYTLASIKDNGNTCDAIATDLSGSAVVNVNNRPTASLSGSQTICNGETADLTIILTGTGPWNLTYNDGTDKVIPITSSPYTLSVKPSSTTNYTLVSLSDAVCASIPVDDLSGSALVSVNARPTSLISGDNTICEGESSNINIDFTGVGPFNFTYLENGNAVTVNNVSDPYDYLVSPPVGTNVYTVQSVSDQNCTTEASDNTGSATIVVNDRPTATISGSTTICAGDNTPLNFTLTGVGPWNIVYTDGSVDYNFSSTTSSTSVSVSPVVNTTYTIKSVLDNGTNCSADNSELMGSAVININSRPTASLTGDQTICNGESANLLVNLTGTGPWDITYNDGVSDIDVSTSSNPYTLSVKPNTTSTYTLTKLSDANCNATAGDLMGSALVNVNPRPTSSITGDATICNGQSTNVTVTLNGTGLFNLTYLTNGVPTTVNGVSNPFVLNTSPSINTIYSVQTVVDQVCTTEPTDNTGSATVNVNEKPTAILDGDITICDGETTNLIFTLTGTGPWAIEYTDGTTTYNQLVNSSPATIPVSPSSNTVYSLVSVTDNGTTCSSDASDMSGTAIVNVNTRPTGVISGNEDICLGETASLNIKLTGVAPWNIVYNDGSTDNALLINSSPFTLNVTPTVTSIYTIVSLSDANCSSIGTDLSGVGNVTVNQVNANISVSAPAPGVTNICAGIAVTFNAAAADGSGDYNYDFHLVRGGVDASVQSSNTLTYTTSTLQNGDQIYVIVTDNINTCTDQSSSITMTVVNNPVPALTVVSAGGSSTICKDDRIDFSATSGYGRYQFIKNNTDVLQDGASNTFSSDALADGDVISVIAYTGSCPGASPGITVTVNPLPTANIVLDNVGRSTVCINEAVDFTANATGNGPFDYLFYVGDGTNFTAQGSYSTTNTFTNSSSDNFTVYVEVQDNNNCTSQSTPVDITISKPIAGLTADKTTICEGDEVTFTGTGGDTYNFFVENVSEQNGASDTYKTTSLNNNDIVSLEITDAFNCTATNSGIGVTVNPIPNVSINSNDLDNIICEGDEVEYTASGGDVFTWYVDGIEVQSESSNNKYTTTTLTNGAIVSVIGKYNATSCGKEAVMPAIVVNSNPIATLSASPSNTIIEGTEVTFTATGGVNYEFFVNGLVEQALSNNNIFKSTTLKDGDVIRVDVYNANDCMSDASTTVAVLDGIILLDVAASELEYCNGDGGVSVYLQGTPQDNVTYELFRSSDNLKVGASIMYSSTAPVPVQWDNLIGNDEYRIEAYYSSVASQRYEMNNRVSIKENPLPTIYNVTSLSSNPAVGCNGGTGHVISLDNSETNVDYTLNLDGTLVETISGTGSQIDFAAQLGIGTYTVTAVNTITGCSETMNGNFVIQGDGSDVAFTVYAVHPAGSTRSSDDGRYCDGETGIEIALDGSLDNTVQYKLFKDGIDTGISIPGNNGVISFGDIADEGTYTVRVESASGCQFPMSGSVDVTIIPIPTAFNVVADNSGHYCAGGTGVSISIDNQEDGVVYSLILNGAVVDTKTGTIASGSPLAFTGLYTTEGEYSVLASVPEIGCEIDMINTIDVIIDALPVVYDLTTDGDYCQGSSTYINLPASESDVNYRWNNLDDNSTGAIIPGTGGVLNIEIQKTGTYEIIAQKNDGVTSCVSVMNGTIAIQEKPLPDTTKIISETYAGTGCDDGSVLTIILSEPGVVYTLVKFDGGVYYPAAVPSITGDGSDISFDPIIDTNNGEYTAMASLNGCEVYLNNSAFVDIPGVVTKQIVTGSGEICNGDPGVIFGLASTEIAVDYQLVLADAVGAITGQVKETITGDGNAMSFSEVNDEGEYYVLGVSATCTIEMANRVTVNVNPLPTAYTLFGSGKYCSLTDGALIQLDNSEENVSYQLQYNDGTGLRNVGIAAIGGANTDTISFGKYTDIGTYTVVATSPKGCTSNMKGQVTTELNVAPTDQTVEYDAISYCQGENGVELRLTNSEVDVTYQVVNSLGDVVSEVIGNGTNPLVLGNTFKADTYSFIASRGGDACIVDINGGSTLEIKKVDTPNKFTVIADSYNVCGNKVNISLDNFDVDIEYQIYAASDPTTQVANSITAVAGGNVSWEITNTTSGSEIYEVIAVSGGTCDLSMGTIEINFNDSLNDFNAITRLNNVNNVFEYCEGTDSISIGVINAQDNVNYFLVDTTDINTNIDLVIGKWVTGQANDTTFFNKKMGEGGYTIKAVLNLTNCEKLMNDTIEIKKLDAPEKFNVIADSYNVCGNEVNISLDNFEVGREYQIYVADDLNTQIESSIIGTAGDQVTWTINETVSGTEIYEVIAVANGTCDLSMGTIEINYKDTPLVPEELLTGSNKYCDDEDGVKVSVKDTEAGIAYILKDTSGKNFGFIDGIGGQMEFSNYIPQGSYYIEARNFQSGCASVSFPSFNIEPGIVPDVFELYIGNDPTACNIYCNGFVDVDDIKLSSSVNDGTIYALYLDDQRIIPFVDSLGTGREINFKTKAFEGRYNVIAISPDGCSIKMDGEVWLQQSALIGIDDYLNVSDGKKSDRLILSYNDIWEPKVDTLYNDNTGTEGEEIEGNLRFSFYPDKNLEKKIGSGTVTIDPKTSELVYVKKPGFFGRDSVKYFIENRNYSNPRPRIDSATVYIYVGNKDINESKSFLIPNAFSPNGDNLNDVFKISGIEEEGFFTAEKSKLEVFNRWGTLVYRSKGDSYGEDGKWWDGTSSTSNMVSIGSDLPNGTYFYIYSVELNIVVENGTAEFLNEDGSVSKTKVKEYSGYIELRR